MTREAEKGRGEVRIEEAGVEAGVDGLATMTEMIGLELETRTRDAASVRKTTLHRARTEVGGAERGLGI